MQITYSVPFSITAELTADTGGGQGLYAMYFISIILLPSFHNLNEHCLVIILKSLYGCTGLAIGVLNLAIVIPQVV